MIYFVVIMVIQTGSKQIWNNPFSLDDFTKNSANRIVDY